MIGILAFANYESVEQRKAIFGKFLDKLQSSLETAQGCLNRLPVKRATLCMPRCAFPKVNKRIRMIANQTRGWTDLSDFAHHPSNVAACGDHKGHERGRAT